MASVDLDKSLTPEHKEKVKQWIAGSTTLRVLVTGKTGTGKSALVNGIVGKYVAEEGASLKPQTSSVEKFEERINDVAVEIFDSPGLQDGTSKEKEYLADMELKCKHVDLILYCLNMNDPRFFEDDRKAISKFTKAFGEDFWKNAICVLTFANLVKQPTKRNTVAMNPEKYFQNRVEEWQSVFCRELIDNGVAKEIADRIPTVPAGYMAPSLPGIKNWLSDLWFTCLSRVADKAKPAFLKINWNRLRAQEDISQENFSKPLHEQSISCSSDRLQKVIIPPVILQMFGIRTLSLGGEVGGKLGGYIGETVGVLAGSPSAGKEVGGVAGSIIGELILSYVQELF